MNFTVKLPYQNTAFRIEVNKENFNSPPVDQEKTYKKINMLSSAESDIERYRFDYFMQVK